MNYYNDNDPFVVDWLKNLILWEIIPPGEGAEISKQNGRCFNVPSDAGRWPHRWLPEPEMVRVVHGLHANPRAVGAYGNAIVPAVAAEFIKAFIDNAPPKTHNAA